MASGRADFPAPRALFRRDIWRDSNSRVVGAEYCMICWAYSMVGLMICLYSLLILVSGEGLNRERKNLESRPAFLFVVVMVFSA